MPTNTVVDLPTFEEYAASAWPSLYRRAYLLSGNHADAEDLAQQTLIKIHASWARVSRADSPQAYARRILTITFPVRDVGTRAAGWSCWPARTRRSRPARWWRGREERMALWPHVRDLPKRQRAVVVLRYYGQGLSEAEIADTLGCSRGNVKSTAHRALQNLRTALDGRED